jgi:ABC-type anion transport system duplicated permease subunit|tara:strand:+ start:197 stop:475 length:279 start_codon:yes stop_codon:yes gene_type:complete
MSTANNNNDSNFEKIALFVLGSVIVSVLCWVALTVNQNQLQYARIEERLANQSVILEDLQKKFNASTVWQSRMETDLALIKQRLSALEQDKK